MRTILRSLAAAAGMACIALASPALAQQPLAPVVATRDGAVQGMVKDGAAQYLGIPFAAPPVGPLRWRPPAPPAPWSGVRKATAFGPSCAQGRDLGDYAKVSDAEDCLYLNVYAPPQPGAAPRAVMVWFPGGGLYVGAADDYDGAKLAARGGVVLVTLNYRLGLLGFLAHPAIDAEGHANGNYGIMDQQAALRWIHDNIAKFGGDPNNVTIFGQSAGGSSVLSHMVSPVSKGLFHKVIVESGQRMNLPSEAEAARNGVKFAQVEGCADPGGSSPATAACLRALTIHQILDHQSGLFQGTIADGQVIPTSITPALRSGAFTHTPAINGLAADEQTFQLAIAEEKDGPLKPEGYLAFVHTTYGAHADEVLAAYPPGAYPSATMAEAAVVQASKACTTRRQDRWLSAGAPTYTYSFDDRTAPSYFPPRSFPLGAYHTSEIPYLFPLFHGGTGTPRPLNAAQTQLSEQMIDAWAAFAKTGNPAVPGLQPWPPYDPARDNVLSLNIPVSTVKDGYGAANNCAFWDKVAGF